MKKFKLKGEEFDIIEKYETTHHEGYHKYEVIKTNSTRQRRLFAFFLWIGKKIRILQNVLVEERLYISRKEDFDDGLTYQTYWLDWEKSWSKEKIL